MTSLNVLICDDHAGFRASLATLLTTGGEVIVMAEAADGGSAVDAAITLQPDVVLMDLNMPGMAGVEATRRIMDNAPHIGVVVLTMVEDDDSVFAAMQAGARGYLLKGARKAEIIRAVRAPWQPVRRSSAVALPDGSSSTSIRLGRCLRRRRFPN